EGSEAEISKVFETVCLQIRDAVAGLLIRLAEEYHRDTPLESCFDHRHVEVLSRNKERDGFIPLEVLHLRHRLYRGGWSAGLRRELVTRPRAVGALLYDPDSDKVVLVRQFRTGMIDEPERPWLLEIVAGLVAAGEAPIDVVQRETLEETNCLVSRILPIFEYFNSPGWNNEKVSLYCAQLDSSTAEGVHGLNEEHEDILVVVLTVDEAIKAVRNGTINNAMSIIALQWLELNREWVRTQWTARENHR
ncbi:MAG: NUDIX domain-containing protein, partial [Pseudohongiellaceae bacterium]